LLPFPRLKKGPFDKRPNVDFHFLRYSSTTDNKLGLVAKFLDVITTYKMEEGGDIIWKSLEPAPNEAITNFISVREREGEPLAKNEKIKTLIGQIDERNPIAVKEYKEKFIYRLSELLDKTPVDEQRIAQEVVVFTDKFCVDEEITRMYNHVEQVKEIFAKEEEAIGRRMDFLIQDVNLN